MSFLGTTLSHLGMSFLQFDSFKFSSLEKCSKLGEGTYGEVFKVKINGNETALKVIGIQYTVL